MAFPTNFYPAFCKSDHNYFTVFGYVSAFCTDIECQIIQNKKAREKYYCGVSKDVL